jgi:hypothetical protein
MSTSNISRRGRRREKNVLDLLQEYASLNDNKTVRGGNLSPEGENRWAELKSFYDLLMEQKGLPTVVRWRYTHVDIREAVVPRARLRVRTEIEIVVLCEKQYHFTRVVNLSCGGVLLAASTPFEPGARLKLYLTAISAVDMTDGEVVWSAESGSFDKIWRYKVGIRFVNLSESVRQRLDSFVVETLEKQLLALDPNKLDPHFVHREKLAW